jgi:UDP-2-acetamido-3-amino-2,3-dideoxy-glucuronate N-acetyltransferase
MIEIKMTEYSFHESAVIDKGARIGLGSEIWHFSHIMSTAIIGKNCTIGQNVFVGSEVIIGDNVKIQNNVSLYTGVICEDHVFIGPSAVFTNVKNPRSEVNRKHEFEQTLVKKGATIGANATIICGNVIGEYAFIGAGAVITKSVNNYALMIGVPASLSGWMSDAGLKLAFDKRGVARCPLSSKTYILSSEGEVKIQE